MMASLLITVTIMCLVWKMCSEWSFTEKLGLFLFIDGPIQLAMNFNQIKTFMDSLY